MSSRPSTKMKWVWHNIHHKENEMNVHKFVDTKENVWYRKLWQRIQRYLNM